MTERDRIVLPEPDSPTNAIISLLFICNEILSNTTLLVFPSSFGKSTLTLSTESKIVFLRDVMLYVDQYKSIEGQLLGRSLMKKLPKLKRNLIQD